MPGTPYDMEGTESQREWVCEAHAVLLQRLVLAGDGSVPFQAEVIRIGRE